MKIFALALCLLSLGSFADSPSAKSSRARLLIDPVAATGWSSTGVLTRTNGDLVFTDTNTSTGGANAPAGNCVLWSASGGQTWFFCGDSNSFLKIGNNTSTYTMWRLSDGAMVSVIAEANVFQSVLGTSATVAKAGGTIDVQTTPVGNVGVGEDTLMTYTLAANALTTTGRGIHYAWSGAVANDVNAKSLKIYFGATAIQTAAVPISVAGHWVTEARIIRTGASAQRYTIITTVTNTATNAVSGVFTAQGTLTETETAAITIKATATATADNDLTQTVAVTEFF